MKLSTEINITWQRLTVRVILSAQNIRIIMYDRLIEREQIML